MRGYRRLICRKSRVPMRDTSLVHSEVGKLDQLGIPKQCSTGNGYRFKFGELAADSKFCGYHLVACRHCGIVVIWRNVHNVGRNLPFMGWFHLMQRLLVPPCSGGLRKKDLEIQPSVCCPNAHECQQANIQTFKACSFMFSNTNCQVPNSLPRWWLVSSQSNHWRKTGSCLV